MEDGKKTFPCSQIFFLCNDGEVRKKDMQKLYSGRWTEQNTKSKSRVRHQIKLPKVKSLIKCDVSGPSPSSDIMSAIMSTEGPGPETSHAVVIKLSAFGSLICYADLTFSFFQ